MKMESGDGHLRSTEPPSRRVTRQSTKEVALVLKPREPLKRRRRDAEHPGGTVLNGSEARERLPSTDVDEPPEKRLSMQSTEDEEGASGSEDEMDLEADGDDQDSDENREMSSEYMEKMHPAQRIKESSVRLVPLKGFPQSTARVVVLEPLDSGLRIRRPIHQTQANSGMDAEALKNRTEPSKRGSGASLHAPTRLVVQKDVRPQAKTVQSSIRQYHNKMQEGLPGIRPTQDLDKRSRRGLAQNQTQNNVSYKKELPRKAELRRSVSNAKIKISSTGGASRVYALILWLFLLCVSLAVAVLAYQRLPWSSLLHWHTKPSPEQEASLSTFSGHLGALEQRFPSQAEEFWRRSRIHLQRHLQTTRPTEPVSFILAGGREAEVTLGCLAACLATAFSSALNGSVLELHGTSLAGKDSDQVKLDLDNQLKEAFEGDKAAAVIHRLEELPPSSTLIFYRYCDHENAAYKHPLLAFTVLLPQDAVGLGVSISQVEEMVHSHIHQKFLTSDQPDTFDRMDVDKLSGLWSRISHLILPVNTEEHVEKGGCVRD